MGGAASINTKDELAILSPEELGNKIASLGPEYEAYKTAFIANNIDGATVSGLSRMDQIATLKSTIGVNETHLDALIVLFESLKTAEAEPTEEVDVNEQKEENTNFEDSINPAATVEDVGESASPAGEAEASVAALVDDTPIEPSQATDDTAAAVVN